MSHTFWDMNLNERRTVAKQAVGESGDAVGDIHVGQLPALVKTPGAQIQHAGRQRDAFQTATKMECVIS